MRQLTTCNSEYVDPHHIETRNAMSHFNALLKSQDNKCMICLQAFPTAKATHVDHDHKTGLVRGLLCMHCNQAIGKFSDSPETLERAAAYLRGLVK